MGKENLCPAALYVHGMSVEQVLVAWHHHATSSDPSSKRWPINAPQRQVLTANSCLTRSQHLATHPAYSYEMMSASFVEIGLMIAGISPRLTPVRHRPERRFDQRQSQGVDQPAPYLLE